MKINDIVVFIDSPIYSGNYLIVADKDNSYKSKSNPYNSKYSVPQGKDFILKPTDGNPNSENPISGISAYESELRLKKD
jgi:hypothetical protein